MSLDKWIGKQEEVPEKEVGDYNLILIDLKRAKEGLAKSKTRVAKNEVQEADIKAEIEHYEHRISYLKRMALEEEGRNEKVKNDV